MQKIKQILVSEDGQGMVEYGLILGLISIAAIAAIAILGPKILSTFTKANSELSSHGI